MTDFVIDQFFKYRILSDTLGHFLPETSVLVPERFSIVSSCLVKRLCFRLLRSLPR